MDPLLTVRQIDDVVLAAFNAALFVTAQISGTRSSEMMEQGRTAPLSRPHRAH